MSLGPTQAEGVNFMNFNEDKRKILYLGRNNDNFFSNTGWVLTSWEAAGLPDKPLGVWANNKLSMSQPRPPALSWAV